jgi:DNA polymerase
MFVVEPPDQASAEADELPAGPMGRLLNDIIVKGLGLDPAQCLITPLVKCPVEDPEDPSALNLAPCGALARREVELARPGLVLALGLTPARAISGLDLVMARLRLRKPAIGPGRVPLRMTYGLAAMVAEPVLKKEVWRDLKGIFALDRPGR